MKHILVLSVMLIASLSSAGQFQKFTTLRSTVHFNFGVRAQSLDDAGAGVDIDAGFFAKHKLLLLVSAHADRFIGDKSYTVPDIGRSNKGGSIYGIHAGPEYHIVPKIAASLTYGVFWHCFQEVGYTADDGYRVALTAFPGKKRKFTVKLSRTLIPREIISIRYYNLGIGWRIL